jgi:ABC-type glycerol-3-phosphate transport system substrate-binding protein
VDVVRDAKLVAALSFVAVLLAGCAGGERSPGSVTFTSPSSEANGKPAAESKILQFEAPKLGGGQIDGGDLKGRDVAIWFWAPW